VNTDPVFANDYFCVGFLSVSDDGKTLNDPRFLLCPAEEDEELVVVIFIVT
jgi:hypothetical protein